MSIVYRNACARGYGLKNHDHILPRYCWRIKSKLWLDIPDQGNCFFQWNNALEQQLHSTLPTEILAFVLTQCLETREGAMVPGSSRSCSLLQVLDQWDDRLQLLYLANLPIKVWLGRRKDADRQLQVSSSFSTCYSVWKRTLTAFVFTGLNWWISLCYFNSLSLNESLGRVTLTLSLFYLFSTCQSSIALKGVQFESLLSQRQ